MSSCEVYRMIRWRRATHYSRRDLTRISSRDIMRVWPYARLPTRFAHSCLAWVRALPWRLHH